MRPDLRWLLLRKEYIVALQRFLNVSLSGRWSGVSVRPLLLPERLRRLQFFLARVGDEPLALRLLARELANAANCFGLFSYSQL
jgi:hypothetical protein